jgi:hypothetical protein
MKKLIAFAIILFNITVSFGQSNSTLQGTVNSYAGKYVFWNHEPVEEYEVVFPFSWNFDIIGLHASQSLQSEEALKNAFMTAMGKDFDAVIIVNGTRNDLAIKFKNPKANNSLCKPIKINNVLVFIDSKPNFEYTTVKVEGYKRAKTNNWKGIISYYASRNIAENLCNLKESPTDILVIGNGANHEWITSK